MELSKERIDGVVRVAKAMLKNLGIDGTVTWANSQVTVSVKAATIAQKLALQEQSESFVIQQGVRISGNYF